MIQPRLSTIAGNFASNKCFALLRIVYEFVHVLICKTALIGSVQSEECSWNCQVAHVPHAKQDLAEFGSNFEQWVQEPTVIPVGSQ